MGDFSGVVVLRSRRTSPDRMGDAGRRRRRLDLSSSYPSPPLSPRHSDRRMWGPSSPRRPHQTPFADPPCIPDDRRGFQLLLLLFVTHLEMEWREIKISAGFPPRGRGPSCTCMALEGRPYLSPTGRPKVTEGTTCNPLLLRVPTYIPRVHHVTGTFLSSSHTFFPTAVLGRRCDRKASNIRSLVKGKTEIEEAPLHFHLTEAKNPDGIFLHSYFQT